MPEHFSSSDPQRDNREVYESQEVDRKDQAFHSPVFVSQLDYNDHPFPHDYQP